ncbi:MAG: hypothetical protein IKO57_05475 [Treponema sp.]|nr:hypothetical protein [Treponema sp.]MBR4629874.1 hypothetical protein [Treponema sp.]MBR6912977.1 hypothetical protein [Treponema sp.]MCR5124443.1 hypothetical protein [Treponema sp.]
MNKTILIPFAAAFGLAFSLTSCESENEKAQLNFEREAKTAKYRSEYATTINQLEMQEGNFQSYRRVVFYNVRLGDTVFCCEGYCHVQIDKDGDIELVVKTGEDSYLRHYLGQKQDITYFSEQLQPTSGKAFNYKITWNPKLWIPETFTKMTN